MMWTHSLFLWMACTAIAENGMAAQREDFLHLKSVTNRVKAKAPRLNLILYIYVCTMQIYTASSQDVLYLYSSKRRNTLGFDPIYSYSRQCNPSLGIHQESHPYCVMNIDSDRINTSLVMMSEWVVQCTMYILSSLEISLGHWDVPQAPGNLLAVEDIQPNPSLFSAVYIYNVALGSMRCINVAL